MRSADTLENNSSRREFLFSAIRDEAILRAEDRRLIGRNGKDNRWLIDIRRVSMRASFLDAVADIFWEMCAPVLPFQVGGMEVAAVPLVSAILMKSVARNTPVNGFIVRKERKTYGTGSLIEGNVSDAPIIIVDDILNSGSSLEKVRTVLAQENKNIALVFVLIDYASPKGKVWKGTHSIPVLAPFRLSEFDLALGKPNSPTPTSGFHNIWNFTAPDPNFYHRVPKSFPATDGKRVYFGSDCGIFWCLNAHDGSVAWNFKVNARGHKNIWSAPAVHNGKVWFGSYDGNVYCLDAESGAEVWRFVGADWVGSSPALAPELGLLFIGLEFATEGKRGSIVALDLETGEKVWEHITKRYTHASPAYWSERQLVACGSNDNEMFLFDARSGAVRWRFQTRGDSAEKGSIRHAPAFDAKRGQIVTGCANGYIYIIDVDTGNEIWSVRTDNTIYTVPLVVDDTAYVGSTDKFLYILDMEQRKVKKKIYASSKIFGPPRLLDGRIYFGACNGLVYEIDPVTESVTGTHQLPDAITNALCFNPETRHFYALTYVSQLFAFRRSSIK
jgi:outer membrane protein assembly factor BamB